MKKHQKRPEQRRFKWLLGIDEVGRGPLAGPVAVCAVAMPFGDFRKNSAKVHKNLIKNSVFKKVKKARLTDSKKLSEKERDEWCAVLKQGAKESHLSFALSYASAAQIDTKGIAVCIRMLLKKNVKKLQANLKFSCDEVLVLLDGSLYAPSEFLYQETIIKGDEKEPIISFASIIAKVSRDAYMKRLGILHPEYGFEVHKGYGTLAHRTAIKKFGPTIHHRRSFLTKLI